MPSIRAIFIPVVQTVHHWVLHSPRLGQLALIAALLGLVFAMFSLAAASGNTQTWANNYDVFLSVNLSLGFALICLVLALLFRLLWRLKKGVFGARLTLKFAGAFAILGLLPGVLVYLVSLLFLHQSIESWFNVRVDRALEAGIELSRAAVDVHLQDLVSRTRRSAQHVSQSNDPLLMLAGQVLADNPSAHVILFDGKGSVLAQAGDSASKGLFADLPTGSSLLALKKTGIFSQSEVVAGQSSDAEQEKLMLRAVVTVNKLQTSVPFATVSRKLEFPANESKGTGMGLSVGGSGQVGGLVLNNTNRGLTLPRALDLSSKNNTLLSRAELSSSSTVYYLQLMQAVPSKTALWAQTMGQGIRDYETLALGRAGLRKIYATTLTLTMLLSVLAAVAAGFVLAEAMSAPLLRLAKGTQAVAAGDFTPLPVGQGQDDLAVLTRSFNTMSSELSFARHALTRSNQFLEQVLESLSSGVVVLSERGQVRSMNPAAKRILAIQDEQEEGAQVKTLALPPAFEAIIAPQLAMKRLLHSPAWQMQPEIEPEVGQAKRTLLLSGAPMSLDDGLGTLLVFEDISTVLVAQRAQAWGEVARRLAHEIKNPLTPIQLSAERLAMKLVDKLQTPDAELLKRATGTIINQVSALKTMVDEFRNYARLPQAKLAAQAFQPLLQEMMQLYLASKDSERTVNLYLLATKDQVLLDEGQLRQVLHNLVGNAIDAAQAAHPSAGAQVDVRVDDHPQGVMLSVQDNGAGFSKAALERLFEPYHTTKTKGTGLGLAIVQRILQEHGASIRVKNLLNAQEEVLGARIEVVFPVCS